MTFSIRYLLLCFITCALLLKPSTTHDLMHVTPQLTKQEQRHILQQYNCIRVALYHESRGEPTEGIRAVLSVINNRKKHKNYPSTYCAVIKQPYQFSFYNTIKHDRTPYSASEARVKAVIDALAFEAAVGVFKSTLDGEYLFFHTVDLKKVPKFSRTSKTSVIIGRHIFYKNKGVR